MNRLRRLGCSAWLLLREAGTLASKRRLSLLLFAGFTLLVAGLIHRWDPAMEAWEREHRAPGFVKAAQLLSDWGRLHLAPFFGLILLAVVGFWRRLPRLCWAALAGLLAGCVGGMAVNILKVIVGRPRPSAALVDAVNWFHFGYDYASFPSGHATHCMAIAVAVVVSAPRSGGAMILASLAVGWSRWYLSSHYVTDVWAGSCLGLAIGLLFGLAVQRIWSGQSEYLKGDLNPVIEK